MGSSNLAARDAAASPLAPAGGAIGSPRERYRLRMISVRQREGHTELQITTVDLRFCNGEENAEAVMKCANIR